MSYKSKGSLNSKIDHRMKYINFMSVEEKSDTGQSDNI